MTNKKFVRALKYIIFPLVWILLTIIYFHVAQTNAINSDGVSNILEAQSILKGNIILHGWTLPIDTFYTLDTQLEVFLLWLGLKGLTVYYLTPAIIYSSLVILAYYIIKQITNSRLSAVTSVAIFVAFPLALHESLVLISPIHMLTILFVILAFYLYQSPNIKRSCIYGSILLYIAIVGDPYAMFIGTLPIVYFASARIYHATRKNDDSPISTYIYIMLSSIAATIFAKATVYTIYKMGGYHIVSTVLRFVSLDNFSHNIYVFTLSLLEVMNSNFFGDSLSQFKTFLDLLHVFLFIASLVLIAIYSFAKNRFERIAMVDLCITSMVITCLAFVFSTEPVDIMTARFLLNIPILISIVFGYLISKGDRRLLISLSLSAIIIALPFALFAIKAQPSSNQDKIEVINFLKSNDLTYGWAGYWNSAPFTLLSNNEVKVRQVLNNNGGIVPFAWLSDSEWYKNPRPQFVIFGKSGNFGLTESVVTKNFGEPKQVKTIGEYKVVVY